MLDVKKVSSSVNETVVSIALVGDANITCRGEIKYKDQILQKFLIKSYDFHNPVEISIDYFNYPDLAVELATGFVLKQEQKIDIVLVNTEKDFIRTETINLTAKVPPVVSNIKLRTNRIAQRYIASFSDALSDVKTYLNSKNIKVSDYQLQQIATTVLLIRNNSKILLAFVPLEFKIPIYRKRRSLNASLSCKLNDLKPLLTLYPAIDNKYYDGPNLYEIAKHYFIDKDVDYKMRIKNRRKETIIERRFDTAKLIGDYDLYLVVADDENNFFYYNTGAVIFDNIAPQFDDWNLGEYYFGGNELYEGKVYLDYKIAGSKNPYDVIFTGKIFGDVNQMFVNFRRVKFKKDSDLLFTQKIYIYNGYKEIFVRLIDKVGNIGDYVLPVTLP